MLNSQLPFGVPDKDIGSVTYTWVNLPVVESVKSIYKRTINVLTISNNLCAYLVILSYSLYKMLCLSQFEGFLTCWDHFNKASVGSIFKKLKASSNKLFKLDLLAKIYFIRCLLLLTRHYSYFQLAFLYRQKLDLNIGISKRVT